MKTLNDGFPNRLDSTYFTATDCEPFVVNNEVHYYDGRGKSRSWGSPQVTTTLIVDDCDFLALHFGFSHKHRGGQAWRYFVKVDGKVERRLWGQLTDDERQIVLDNEGKAPRWSKSPGKLRKDYAKPSLSTFTAYKVLRVNADGFVSLYDDTTWGLGKRNGEAAKDDHGGGYYVHTNPDKLMALWESGDLVPDRCYQPGQYALVRCECSGNTVSYSSGKIAVTYCRPVTIVTTFEKE